MKRFIVGIIAIILVLTFASCGKDSKPTGTPVTPSPGTTASISYTPTETPTPTPSPTPTKTPTATATVVLPAKISPADAKTVLDTDKTAIFVDVRAKTDYDTEHIPGAINIPYEEFAARYTELLSAPRIIVYSGCFT